MYPKAKRVEATSNRSTVWYKKICYSYRKFSFFESSSRVINVNGRSVQCLVTRLVTEVMPARVRGISCATYSWVLYSVFLMSLHARIGRNYFSLLPSPFAVNVSIKRTGCADLRPTTVAKSSVATSSAGPRPVLQNKILAASNDLHIDLSGVKIFFLVHCFSDNPLQYYIVVFQPLLHNEQRRYGVDGSDDDNNTYIIQF